MSDRFDRMMGKFLTPIPARGLRVKDSLYFLRRDGFLIFSHGYYHPTPGYFIGKIIYYPTSEGTVDIWGRRYQAMHKVWKDREQVAIMNDVQLTRHFEIDPSLDPQAPRPPVADYTLEFPLVDFTGFFEPHRSLRLCMEMYPEVRDWAETTAMLMDFPLEKMGVTGSLAYGRIEEDDMDFDVVFMGNREENARVLSNIYRLAEKPGVKVFEFGRYWPIRIYWEGFLLCPFFVYENWGDVPLATAEVNVLREGIEGTATVTDDRDNAYLPLLLGLGDVEITGKAHQDIKLICYDGSIRGDLRTGDRIWFKGRLLNIRDAREEYRAVAVDISFNLRRCGIKAGRYRQVGYQQQE